MPTTGLPPYVQERVVCSIESALKYDIPANIVLAVAEQEGGRPGQWVRNTNGTDDVGPMQFNTAYLAGLARYGITAEDVAHSGCYPYELAAWRLRGHLRNDKGDIWTRAADYHSRTPLYNAEYRAQLIVKGMRWAHWLQARYATVDVTKLDSVHAPTLPVTAVTAIADPNVVASSNQSAKPVHRHEPAQYVPRSVSIGSN